MCKRKSIKLLGVHFASGPLIQAKFFSCQRVQLGQRRKALEFQLTVLEITNFDYSEKQVPAGMKYGDTINKWCNTSTYCQCHTHGKLSGSLGSV